MTKKKSYHLLSSNSDEKFWENRAVRIDKRTGLINSIFAWTSHDERLFVQSIGDHSEIGFTHKQSWWLKKYIEANKHRTERHIQSGVTEARKILQTL